MLLTAHLQACKSAGAQPAFTPSATAEARRVVKARRTTWNCIFDISMIWVTFVIWRRLEAGLVAVGDFQMGSGSCICNPSRQIPLLKIEFRKRHEQGEVLSGKLRRDPCDKSINHRP